MAYKYSQSDIDAELARRQPSAAPTTQSFEQSTVTPEATPQSFEYSQADIDAELAKRQPKMPIGGLNGAAFTTATNPLGFGDEIKAGIAAGVAKIFGGAATQNIDIGDLYREARTSERAKLEKARQDRPSMTGMIETPSNLARGAIKGLEQTGSGIYQTAADFGADFSGAKAILSKIRPDLKNEIESLTPQDISSILGEKAAQDSKAREQEGLAYKTGRFAGKVAPFLGVGGANPVGLAIGGAASGASELMEDSSAGKRLGSAAVGAVAAPVFGKVIEEAVPAAQSLGIAVIQAPKKLLQKITGIDPKAVKTFQDLGIDPTLADVSKSAGLQNFIKDIPVAGKPITEALQKQVNDISGQIQGVTKSQGGTYSQTGKEILKGAEDIVEKSRLRSEQLYKKVDEFIPAETPVSMDSTFKSLLDRKVQITGAVSGGKVAGYNKFITDIQNNLAQGKQVPYDSLTALRSEVGTALQGKLEPQERSALNKIYSGLTEDIKTNIQRSDLNKIGKQSALQAWEKANTSHRLRTRFIQDNIQPLLDKGTPEEVYKYAISQSKLGGTKISQIMRSLNEPQKDFVRSTLVRDMGLAQKGAQSAEGDVFNPQKFMAEYSVLKKNGTEKAIFTPEQITAYNRLNKVVELTKNTEQAGKSNKMLQMVGLGTVGYGTGPVGLAASVGIGRAISSKLMANPKFINWVAVASQATPKELPKQFNRLSAITAANPEIREDVLNFVANFGASDAEASEPNLSEEQIRQQMLDSNQQDILEGLPPVYTEEDLRNNPSKIKKRYYR
jgi:hypothetical protein